MSLAMVQKVGETLVLEIPRELQQDFREGDQVEFDVEHRAVRVTRQPKYTMQELLDQCDFTIPMSEEDREWDSMKPVGRELI